jgi:phage terminase large subunit-like protein
MAANLAITAANDGAKVAWIAPTYKNTRPLWATIERALSPVYDVVAIRRADREVDFPNGGRIAIYSADNADAIRGESFHFVIEDEAARIDEAAHADAIMPTLADYNGRLMAISTPKGKNWFWREWAKAKADPGLSMAFQAPTSDNPSPNIRRAYDMARLTVSDKTFRQEWNAEFTDDGAVFSNVRAAAKLKQGSAPPADHMIVAGIDWAGTGEDYTVVTVFDATAKCEIAKERFNNVGWDMAEKRVEATLRKWNVSIALGEDNGLGGPMNARLRKSGLRVRDWHTSNPSKADIIEDLVMAFEQGAITILNDGAALLELEAFESKRLPSGAIQYAAPSGTHDDCVMSLAIAWRAVSARAFTFG